MVSKAADRSRRTEMLVLPASLAVSRSLTTVSRAVSVLCCALNPDWSGSNSFWSDMWDWSWKAMAPSRILLRKRRFDMSGSC